MSARLKLVSSGLKVLDVEVVIFGNCQQSPCWDILQCDQSSTRKSMCNFTVNHASNLFFSSETFTAFSSSSVPLVGLSCTQDELFELNILQCLV